MGTAKETKAVEGDKALIGLSTTTPEVEGVVDVVFVFVVEVVLVVVLVLVVVVESKEAYALDTGGDEAEAIETTAVTGDSTEEE